MAYTPFKMKGHSLPGINQKGNKTVKGASPVKQKDQLDAIQQRQTIASDRIDLQDKQHKADVRKGAQAKKHRISAITGSPMKQGLRDPKKDYTDPAVRKAEIEGNKRMIENRKRANPNAFKKNPMDVKPSDKNKGKRSKGGLKKLTPEMKAKLAAANKKKTTKPSPVKGFLGDLAKGKGALGAINPLGAIGSKMGMF